jgi:hypothetical protein
MRSARRSIFRYEAVRRYAQGRGKAVLPQFVRPLTFVWLWVLLGLLLVAAGYLASSARFVGDLAGVNPLGKVGRQTSRPEEGQNACC